MFVAKVKNGFVPRIRDELFPALKTLQTCQLPLQESAREKGLAVGRIANRRENGSMPVGETEAGLPDRLRRMDRCRHLRHCTFIGMRDEKKPAEVVRET